VAIALVNTSTGTVATDPATFSFTCNSGADLLVVLYLWRTTGTAQGVGTTTYGAQDMTTLTNARNGSAGVAVFFLYAPVTESALTITADMTAAATAGRMVAAAFSGADSAHVPIRARVRTLSEHCRARRRHLRSR
jgi:hypothetical protein